ncbi:hypothetical protein EGW08_013443 [Elysia chlorotica]|uniref:Uncharacterized protein n=1 Tax=Elysia chlorotica TaxID=188477 RepID=A0A3S1BEA6_ELYCH|nr:hypothetical protein EGW08_013443 [Elysia chlorotica]
MFAPILNCFTIMSIIRNYVKPQGTVQRYETSNVLLHHKKQGCLVLLFSVYDVDLFPCRIHHFTSHSFQFHLSAVECTTTLIMFVAILLTTALSHFDHNFNYNYGILIYALRFS